MDFLAQPTVKLISKDDLSAIARAAFIPEEVVKELNGKAINLLILLHPLPKFSAHSSSAKKTLKFNFAGVLGYL